MNPPLSELEKGDINTLFKEFMETINVQNKAYALSDCHEQFEQYLEKSNHKGTLFSNSEKTSTLMIQTVIGQRVTTRTRTHNHLVHKRNSTIWPN